jgi:endonuclease/exonuclease/phosphatase family metal-dependent hydrolase
MKFTVATLNAGGFVTGTYFKDVSQDFPTIGRLMGNWVRKYDIVLLQEVYEYFGTQLEMIRASSGHAHSHWHKGEPFQRGVNSGLGGQGVLSKYPIEAEMRHLYWQKPKEPGDPPSGWPLSELTIRIGGVPIHFFTAHYPHAFPNQRSASLLAVDLVGKLPPLEPVVFGADFNASPCDEPARITGNGLLQLASGTGGEDIDHILGRHIRVHRTWHSPLVEAGKTLTDHPIVGIEAEARVAPSTPATRIDSGPPAPPQTSPGPSATFTFSSATPGATFECSLDCARFQPCTSPATFPNLKLGQHWLSIRATDAQGNREPVPVIATWIVVRPQTVTVPDVEGVRQIPAAQQIRAVGLKVKTVGGSTNPRENEVVTQDPKGGTTAPTGSTVTLTLASF